MTGKRPPRYQIQRDYGQGWITVREYTMLYAALIELLRLKTHSLPVRLWDKRLHREVES